MTKAEAEFYAEAIGGVADGFMMAGIMGIIAIVAAIGIPFSYAVWKEYRGDKNKRAKGDK